MTSLTIQSEHLVELSEDQQEVVSGGGGHYWNCRPKYERKKKYCYSPPKPHYPC